MNTEETGQRNTRQRSAVSAALNEATQAVLADARPGAVPAT